MPAYEYQCPKCKIVEEVECPMKDRDNERFCTCGCEMCRVYTTVPHFWLNCEWPSIPSSQKYTGRK